MSRHLNGCACCTVAEVSILIFLLLCQALHLRDQIREVARPRSLTFDDTESRDPLSLANNTEQTNSATNAIVPRNDKQLVLETRLCNEYGLHLDSSLETRLKCNAIIAYTSLGAISIGKNKYGRAIKCLKIALSCLGMINYIYSAKKREQSFSILKLVSSDTRQSMKRRITTEM